MWAVLTVVLRSAPKAGLATAIFLGLLFSYGHLHDGLERGMTATERKMV